MSARTESSKHYTMTRRCKAPNQLRKWSSDRLFKLQGRRSKSLSDFSGIKRFDAHVSLYSTLHIELTPSMYISLSLILVLTRYCNRLKPSNGCSGFKDNALACYMTHIH
ncbi:hypothetical protein BDR07DRAFT_701548 [Suillus spraguei]|nr:hypothetical protein BDR07DRAFT_701548 [Suillus spraguei]